MNIKVWQIYKNCYGAIKQIVSIENVTKKRSIWHGKNKIDHLRHYIEITTRSTIWSENLKRPVKWKLYEIERVMVDHDWILINK